MLPNMYMFRNHNLTIDCHGMGRIGNLDDNFFRQGIYQNLLIVRFTQRIYLQQGNLEVLKM